LFWDEYFDVTNSSPTFQEFFFCIPVSNHAINSAVIAVPQCQHSRLVAMPSRLPVPSDYLHLAYRINYMTSGGQWLRLTPNMSTALDAGDMEAI